MDADLTPITAALADTTVRTSDVLIAALVRLCPFAEPAEVGRFLAGGLRSTSG